MLPDCIGMKVDEAIQTIKRQMPSAMITIKPTFDPKYKGDIIVSDMIVVRQRANGDEVELIIVSNQ